MIKPTFPAPAAIADLRRAAQSARSAKRCSTEMRAIPADYVAQEQVALSTVPVWERGPLQPRHLVLRVFAVAAGDSYAVMPGGLTRITTSLDSLVVSMQHGGGSKDTWVLGDGPAPPFSLLRPASASAGGQPRHLRSSQPHGRQPVLAGPLRRARRSAVRIARAILPRVLPGSRPAARRRARGRPRVLRRWATSAPSHGNGKSAPPTAEREVLAMIYDPDDAQRPGLESPSGAPRRLAAARPHLRRRLADSQSLGPAILRPRRRPSHCASARAQDLLEPRHHHALGLQRPGDGEHDARPWLALSRYRPAPGARHPDGRVAAPWPAAAIAADG